MELLTLNKEYVVVGKGNGSDWGIISGLDYEPQQLLTKQEAQDAKTQLDAVYRNAVMPLQFAVARLTLLMEE